MYLAGCRYNVLNSLSILMLLCSIFLFLQSCCLFFWYLFHLEILYKACIVCAIWYIYHKMTNIKSNYILSLRSINVCSSSLPAALYSLRCSKSLSGFRNLFLYDRRLFYNPSFLLQMFSPVFLFSLFLVCIPTVWAISLMGKTKPKMKNRFKKCILPYMEKTCRQI